MLVEKRPNQLGRFFTNVLPMKGKPRCSVPMFLKVILVDANNFGFQSERKRVAASVESQALNITETSVPGLSSCAVSAKSPVSDASNTGSGPKTISGIVNDGQFTDLVARCAYFSAIRFAPILHRSESTRTVCWVEFFGKTSQLAVLSWKY